MNFQKTARLMLAAPVVLGLNACGGEFAIEPSFAPVSAEQQGNTLVAGCVWRGEEQTVTYKTRDGDLYQITVEGTDNTAGASIAALVDGGNVRLYGQYDPYTANNAGLNDTGANAAYRHVTIYSVQAQPNTAPKSVYEYLNPKAYQLAIAAEMAIEEFNEDAHRRELPKVLCADILRLSDGRPLNPNRVFVSAGISSFHPS